MILKQITKKRVDAFFADLAKDLLLEYDADPDLTEDPGFEKSATALFVLTGQRLNDNSTPADFVRIYIEVLTDAYRHESIQAEAQELQWGASEAKIHLDENFEILIYHLSCLIRQSATHLFDAKFGEKAYQEYWRWEAEKTVEGLMEYLDGVFTSDAEYGPSKKLLFQKMSLRFVYLFFLAGDKNRTIEQTPELFVETLINTAHVINEDNAFFGELTAMVGHPIGKKGYKDMVFMLISVWGPLLASECSDEMESRVKPLLEARLKEGWPQNS